MTSRLLHKLRSDSRAAGVVEFALVAPVLLSMVVGVVQLGRLYLANAGLASAVEDAARYATIWPRPTQAQITSRIAARRWGLESARLGTPTVTFTNSDPDYVTISMTYNFTLNYVLGERTITLTETRRAFVTD